MRVCVCGIVDVVCCVCVCFCFGDACKMQKYLFLGNVMNIFVLSFSATCNINYHFFEYAHIMEHITHDHCARIRHMIYYLIYQMHI